MQIPILISRARLPAGQTLTSKKTFRNLLQIHENNFERIGRLNKPNIFIKIYWWYFATLVMRI